MRATKSEKVYLFSNLLKAIGLGYVVYHDAYDDPSVWFVLFQSALSIILWFYLSYNRSTTRVDIHRLARPLNMVLRVVALFVLGNLWQYHNDNGATFAWVFYGVVIIEVLCAAFVGYYSGKTTQKEEKSASSFIW